VTFDFEFKRNFDGTTDFGPTGNTNSFAFVRVLNQLDETFFTLVEDEFETTDADGATWAQGQVTLTIDPSFDGQLLEFGFNTQCQNDNGSGILYDNLVFTAAAAATTIKGDVDMSGVVDFADIPAFISVLQSGMFLAEADCDCDLDVDFDDIPAFIAILQAG
jgi:hypothetical protein